MKVITVVGPTASGKTAFAAQLAARIGAEIISGDSRQVFRGMDLGTGKDLEEYVVNGKQVPYHLIDIRDAGEKYNVAEFHRDFFCALEEIRAGNRPAILCGGTGMYIESVLGGYDQVWIPKNTELRAKLCDYTQKELIYYLDELKQHKELKDRENRRRVVRAIEINEYFKNHPEDLVRENNRPEIEPVIFGLSIDRENRREKISSRLRRRMEEGMLDEVSGLLSQGVAAEDLIYYGLEYKWVTLHVIGKISLEEMFEKLERNIHQFAKRQMTWFRGMERRGYSIHWIDALQPMEAKLEEALKLLER
ncbi:MAG: tRNA (adenosine(37)-N6)-dimethylallyltransferase MiaA [Cytophagales bacterium]|nr:tRNA (adenosine(37)-N6)-dimethylallyltransferase MiaA [Cytophagales bacterium]